VANSTKLAGSAFLDANTKLGFIACDEKFTSDQYEYMTSCSRIPVLKKFEPKPLFLVAGFEELASSLLVREFE